jgi:hypothetical protein
MSEISGGGLALTRAKRWPGRWRNDLSAVRPATTFAGLAVKANALRSDAGAGLGDQLDEWQGSVVAQFFAEVDRLAAADSAAAWP